MLCHSIVVSLAVKPLAVLIHSLVSQHCKLQKVSLRDCTVSTTDHSYQFSLFELQQANAKVSLNATGSSSAINHCLSLLSLYSKLLTDIILNTVNPTQSFELGDCFDQRGTSHSK